MKDIETIAENALSEALKKAAASRSSWIGEEDLERYQAYLDDPALSHDQRAEILSTFWSVISAFVELGFGVHPVQQACGKTRTELERAGFSESTDIQSDQYQKLEKQTPAP